MDRIFKFITVLYTEASGDAELKRIKLSYSTPEMDSAELVQEWNTVLSQAHTIPQDELRKLVIKGIPPSKRSEVWPILASRYRTTTNSDWVMPTSSKEHESLHHLLNMDTEFEHNIVVDLGKQAKCLLAPQMY